MKKTTSLAILGLAISMMSMPGMAQPQQPYNPPMERGQAGSNHNLMVVQRHLQAAIDALAHDQRNYGGHKAQTMQLLRQAQQQLNQAEQYAAQHGH